MGDPRENPLSSLKRLRNEVIEKLKLNYAHGNLDEDELEARLSRATYATGERELLVLTKDLPEIREGAAASDAPSISASGVPLNQGRVKNTGTILAMLSGALRKGAWKPPRRLTAVAVMGGVELDFTQAVMPPGTTELVVFALMGGVEIKVPPGLNVEMSGLPILGGFEDRSAGMVDETAPTLRVKGIVVMGGVEASIPRKARVLRRDLRARRRREEWDDEEE